MVQIRKNQQKQLTSHHVDMQLLRADFTLGTVRMFVGLINVLWVEANAP